MKRAEDLSGKTFGKLTAISIAEPYISNGGQKRTTWLCRCACGRERVVRAADLKRGVATHCGKCSKFARSEAKNRVCRFCKYSEWDTKLGEWHCLKGKDPTKVTLECKSYWCGEYDKVSRIKNRESKCLICGEPIYSHGKATPIYCEKHRAHAKADDKILDEAPLELLFVLMAGIFARARDDYIFNADNQRGSAEAFLRSDWAQELSVKGFDVDELFERLDEDMLDAISGTGKDNE